MKIPEEVVNREEMLPQWLSSEVRHAFSGARCTAQQVWRKIISLSGTSLPPAERLKSAVFDGTRQSPSSARLPALSELRSICPVPPQLCSLAWKMAKCLAFPYLKAIPYVL